MSAWAGARRVLAVRLDNIGDVLMTTPALRALKGAVAGRRLTLWASPAGAQASACLPEVDETLVYGAPWMKAAGRSGGEALDRRMIARLRAGRFDAAVVFTVYTQSALPAALMCHLAGIPLRLAHCRENPYGLLTDWVRESEPDGGVRHEVRRQLDLVASVGCRVEDERLGLRLRAAARRRVDALLVAAGVDPAGSWILVHPGASAPSRRYPAAGFAAAARALAKDHGYAIVFSGSEEESPLIESIRAEMGAPAVSLAGSVGFEELGALVARSRLLISNNTGPAHIAAAVGTPVVDLYALTNPQHTPWAVPSRVLYHDVPCRFCYKSVCPEGHHDCLRRVPPAAIVRAARALLKEAEC